MAEIGDELGLCPAMQEEFGSQSHRLSDKTEKGIWFRRKKKKETKATGIPSSNLLSEPITKNPRGLCL